MDENRKKELFRSLSPEEFLRLAGRINPKRAQLGFEIGKMQSLAIRENSKSGGNAGIAARYLAKAKELQEELNKTPMYLEETCVLSVTTTMQDLSMGTKL